MLKTHVSPSSKPNPDMKPLDRKRGGGNVSWLSGVLKKNTSDTLSLLLLGGTNLTHFRLRIAQSHARRDLLPSFWSHVAILDPASMAAVHEISLEPHAGFQNVPAFQGIQLGRAEDYDNPELFPNIALVQWKLKEGSLAGQGATAQEALSSVIKKLYIDRGTVDIASPLWSWLGYVWGITDQSNPLLRGIGVPSSVFVEIVFSMLGVDVTPGLATPSSCPEAIWQAAKWWGDFYDSEATLTESRPSGFYCIGQAAAAVTIEEQGRRGARPSPAARRALSRTRR